MKEDWKHTEEINVQMKENNNGILSFVYDFLVWFWATVVFHNRLFLPIPKSKVFRQSRQLVKR